MHFLLDTNVVSEFTSGKPDIACKRWVDACPKDCLYFSAPGEAELYFGIENKPMGIKRELLTIRTDVTLFQLFKGRILPFDSTAALAYGDIKITRKNIGRPVENVMDLQMAAIGRVHDMAIVTRNVKDFEHVGLVIINPWDDVAGVREPRASYGLAQAA